MKQRLISLATARRVGCVLALTLGAGAAHADLDYIGSMTVTKSVMRSNLNWVRKHQQCGPAGVNAAGFCIREQSSPHAQASPRGARVSLDTGKDFATRNGINQLASSFPVEKQPEIAKIFTSLIIEFNKTIPRTYGIPKNNLATAYAAILAGSYAAYTNRPFPDNAVKPLYQQAERAMSNNPMLAKASMDEKNAQYQIWVGTAAFMLGWQSNLSKKPNPEQQAKMQKAGAEILHSLGVDPGKVRFTRRGMEMD